MHPRFKKISSVDDPCVRQCTLDSQDVCLGCARTLFDILHWHQYDVQKKQHLYEQHQQLLSERAQKSARVESTLKRPSDPPESV